MVLCDQEGCINQAVATVAGDEGEQRFCADCIYDTYGVRRCANARCPKPAQLVLTIAWAEFGAAEHYFCSQECAKSLLVSLGTPKVDEAIDRILGGA